MTAAIDTFCDMPHPYPHGDPHGDPHGEAAGTVTDEIRCALLGLNGSSWAGGATATTLTAASGPVPRTAGSDSSHPSAAVVGGEAGMVGGEGSAGDGEGGGGAEGGGDSCTKCGTTSELEPDEDNPGVYYCNTCWDEYECEQQEEGLESTRLSQPCMQAGREPSVEVSLD